MSRLTSLLALALAVFPAVARADVPPADGLHYVPFRFRVEGAAKFADYVIVADPCSDSDGAPNREHAVAEEGKWIYIGRRGGSCTLYAVRRATYEELTKGYLPPHSDADPTMDALRAKATKCNLAPSPRHTLPTDDPRNEITQTLRVEKIDDTTCDLVAASVAQGDGGSNPAAPKSGGCAGCAVGDEAVVSGAGLASLLLGLATLGRRRRQKSA
jgi:MYXO-CTERM domain-containing protein